MKPIPFAKTRISDQVKAVLKETVLGLKPGDRIPSEEEITRQLNVSKVTVRAALSALEAEGLLERRRGVFGGSFVAQPSSGKMGEVVMNYYRMGNITPEDLLEFRQILEPTLAELAASRRTPQDLAALKRVIDEYEHNIENQDPVDITPAYEFHYLVADISHNALISHVMRALAMVFESILKQLPQDTVDLRGDLEFSRRMYECFVRRDGQGARAVMIEHFDALRGHIEKWRAMLDRKNSGEADANDS